MGLAPAIQADADIGQADLLQHRRLFPGKQSTVGGKHRPHAPFDSVLGKLRKILPHQGFAAGKEQDGAAEGGQILDHRLGLRRRQLIAVLDVLGAGVAVDALQVAPPGHVPDDDRTLVLGKLEEMGGQPA